MRVLICGGRAYSDWYVVEKTLDTLHAYVGGIEFLAHGDAAGADRLANRWAAQRDVDTQRYPADWKRGKSAGPMRNQRMLDDFVPELVVAFPGGRGTDDMTRRAKRVKVPVLYARRHPCGKGVRWEE